MSAPPATTTAPPIARAVIAVGASAGGVQALSRFLGALPADLPAAVVVVLHLSPQHPSLLPAILGRRTALPVQGVLDEPQPLLAAHVYVAGPDRHLTVTEATVGAAGGPRENGHRPAFDVTLRSVADAFGPAGLGVVLSGARADGTLGLVHLSQRGGPTMAQDPEEAEHDGMPASAIAGDDVGVVAPAEELGRRAADWAARIAAGRVSPLPAPTPEEARPTPLTCPECGGVLSRLSSALEAYGCTVGHRYGAEALRVEQARRTEGSLWASARLLRERATLLHGFAVTARASDDDVLARRLDGEADLAHRRSVTVAAMAGGEDDA